MAHTRPRGAASAHSQEGATVQFHVQLKNGRCGRRRLRAGQEAEVRPNEAGNVPRLARLMALAIRLDGLIREGAVRDYAELARVGHVTRARVTQIMNLLNLAPDIQEAILFLPRTVQGKDPVTERQIRQVVRAEEWGNQRSVWKRFGQDAVSRPNHLDAAR